MKVYEVKCPNGEKHTLVKNNLKEVKKFYSDIHGWFIPSSMVTEMFDASPKQIKKRERGLNARKELIKFIKDQKDKTATEAVLAWVQQRNRVGLTEIRKLIKMREDMNS